MLTVEDLRNDDRKSGFDRVQLQSDWPVGKKRFMAQIGGGGSEHIWRGPRRATAEEAAQDFCDYVNQGNVKLPPRLKSAGHKGKRDPMTDPEVQHALGILRDARAQKEGRQGYVYCIGEPIEPGMNAPFFVKVGYSTNPAARVAELQTGNPRVLTLLGYFPGTMEDEAKLHAKYARFNELQEWFRPPLALLSEFGIHTPTKGASS